VLRFDTPNEDLSPKIRSNYLRIFKMIEVFRIVTETPSGWVEYRKAGVVCQEKSTARYGSGLLILFRQGVR